MSFSYKNHPILGSDSVFNAWRTEKQAATFKGTLLGIVVSFFIIIFLAYLLNLASNHSFKDSRGEDYQGTAEMQNEQASEDMGGVSFDRPGPDGGV